MYVFILDGLSFKKHRVCPVNTEPLKKYVIGLNDHIVRRWINESCASEAVKHFTSRYISVCSLIALTSKV